MPAARCFSGRFVRSRWGGTSVAWSLAGLWLVAGWGALGAPSPDGARAETGQVGSPRKPSSGPPVPTNLADQEALASPAEGPGDLRREGAQLRDQRGHFEALGDRLAFISADRKTRFVGLENLNLQRIAQIVVGSTGPLEWTVSGLITEYQGTNYLLVTRAARTNANSGRRRSF